MDLNKSNRLMSLDVLRGLDMFFLTCLSYVFLTLPEISDNALFNWLVLCFLFLTLPEISDNALFNWLASQCEHPEWAGFTMYDIVFPMFIFIVGVAMPFSFTRRMGIEGGKKETV